MSRYLVLGHTGYRSSELITVVKKHDCLGPLNEFGQPISTWNAEPGPGSCSLRGRNTRPPSGRRDNCGWGCPKVAFFGGMILGAACTLVAREYYVHGNMDNIYDSIKKFRIDDIWSSFKSEESNVRTVSFNRNTELNRVKSYYEKWR